MKTNLSFLVLSALSVCTLPSMLISLVTANSSPESPYAPATTSTKPPPARNNVQRLVADFEEGFFNMARTSQRITCQEAQARAQRYLLFLDGLTASKGAQLQKLLNSLKGDITEVASLDAANIKAFNIKNSKAPAIIKSLSQFGKVVHDSVREHVSYQSGNPTRALSASTVNPNLQGPSSAPESSLNQSHRSLQVAQWNVAAIKAHVVPVNSSNRAKVLVCVIDSGVDLEHPGIQEIQKNIGGDIGLGLDQCGYGTHTTGVIGGYRGIGVAPGINMFHVQVYSSSSCRWTFSSDLIGAAERCRAAANQVKGRRLVINANVGGYNASEAERFYFTRLFNVHGVLTVAPAGSADQAIPYWYPAAYSTVLSVGSVDWTRKLSSFSHRNDEVDITAPGSGIYSFFLQKAFATLSSTSSAAAHVSAAAATVWSYNPNWSNVQVRDALLSSTDPLMFQIPGISDTRGTGKGILNLCKAARKAGFDPRKFIMVC